MKIFEPVAAAVAAGRAVALATVVDTAGSTPRHLGARMAIADDGATWGTIGGGRIELEVTSAGRAVAAGAPPVRARHHLVRDLAMCCGGAMEVVIAPVGPSAAVLAAAAAAVRARRPAVLDTPLDGGPLRLHEVPRAEAAAWRRPARSPDGAALREAVGVGERVVVLGAGHVGRAIGAAAARCDFEVVLCDDGDTGALDAPAPWASVVVDSFDLDDVARAVGGLGGGDAVLIVTRDHAVDQRILEQALVRDDLALDFLGMIGSRGKVGRFHKRLVARGALDGARGAARWARLTAPIGLDLGAETPEEIAVAVVAQLIALRRRGAAEAGRWQRGEPGEAPAAASPVHAVVLAAGRGERLGVVAKALLPDDAGRTFLARIAATAVAAGVPATAIVVVVGAPFGEAVAAEAARLGLAVVVNPDPSRGMASSVAAGFGWLDARHPAGAAARALLWPVDHPAVTAATVAALIEAGATADVVVPRHAGRGGHPAVIARAAWPALAACDADEAGARAVLRDPRWRRLDVEVDDAAVVRDVDAPADLRGDRS